LLTKIATILYEILQNTAKTMQSRQQYVMARLSVSVE